MKPGATKQNHVVHCDLFPSPAGNFRKQHMAGFQRKIPCRKSGDFLRQLADFTGGQKTHPAQIDTQNRLFVCHTLRGGTKQRAVTPDRDDLLGLSEGLVPGQKPCRRSGKIGGKLIRQERL